MEEDNNIIEGEYRVLDESTIIHDDFDKKVFTKALATLPNLKKLGGEVASRTGEYVANSLLQDIFYTFYKKVPVQKDRADIKASRQINFSITREILENPKWKDVRSSGTPGDWYYSSLATITTLRQILPTLKDSDLDSIKAIESWERKLETLLQHEENLDEIIKESERRLKEAQEAEDAEEEEGGEESEAGDDDDESDDGDDSDFDWDDEDIEDIDNEALPQDKPKLPAPSQEKIDELKERRERMEKTLKDSIESFKELSQEFSPENPKSQIDFEKIEQGAAQMASIALTQAEKELDEAEDSLKAFGGTGVLMAGTRGIGKDEAEASSDLTMVESKILIAESLKYNLKLNIIAKIAGRMFRIANRVQESKAKGNRLVVTGITRGDEIQNVLPMEITKLDDPNLRMLFLADFAEKNLMQYKRENKDKQGKGPIIMALDVSSSMTGSAGRNLEGTRENWSKGVMLALIGIANKQQRDFIIINFNSSGRTRNFEFKKGRATAQELLQACIYMPGGGTRYQDWINETKEYLNKTELKKADIILVSDGEGYLTPTEVEDFNQLRREKEVRCYSIMIGYYTLREDSVVRAISDEIMFLNDKADESSITSKIFGV